MPETPFLDFCETYYRHILAETNKKHVGFVRQDTLNILVVFLKGRQGVFSSVTSWHPFCSTHPLQARQTVKATLPKSTGRFQKQRRDDGSPLGSRYSEFLELQWGKAQKVEGPYPA